MAVTSMCGSITLLVFHAYSFHIMIVPVYRFKPIHIYAYANLSSQSQHHTAEQRRTYETTYTPQTREPTKKMTVEHWEWGGR